MYQHCSTCYLIDMIHSTCDGIRHMHSPSTIMNINELHHSQCTRLQQVTTEKCSSFQYINLAAKRHKPHTTGEHSNNHTIWCWSCCISVRKSQQVKGFDICFTALASSVLLTTYQCCGLWHDTLSSPENQYICWSKQRISYFQKPQYPVLKTWKVRASHSTTYISVMFSVVIACRDIIRRQYIGQVTDLSISVD